jgi:hypothetical protein
LAAGQTSPGLQAIAETRAIEQSEGYYALA